MTIDLRRAGPGWTVRTHAGATLVISSVVTYDDVVSVYYRGYDRAYDYCLDGSARYHRSPTPMTIIALDPPPMTEAQMREALAEIARITRDLDQNYAFITVAARTKVQNVLALAEGKP